MNLETGKKKIFSAISYKIPLSVKISYCQGTTKTQKIRMIENVKYSVKKFYNKALSEIYGVKFDDENFLLYLVFPEIVVNSDNQMIKKITEDSYYHYCSTTKNGIGCFFEIFTNIDNLFIQDEDSNKKYFDFDIPIKRKFKNQEIFIQEFTANDLFDIGGKYETENYLSLSCDRIDFLIEIFRSLDNGNELFRKYLIVFCSTFVKHNQNKIYNERKGTVFNPNTWIDFAKSFGVNENDAKNALAEQENFAYTVLTLEEILRAQSDEMNLRIEKFNRELFIYNVKNLLRSQELVNDDSLWKIFSEYIRRDHFFADKEIIRFTGTICKIIDPKDLRHIANRFVDEIRAIRDLISMEEVECEDEEENAEESENKKSQINKRVYTRCQLIINPFLDRKGLQLMKDACGQYLNTEIKKGSSKSSICFKDLCAVYTVNNGKKTLDVRKPFMEDHFFYSTQYNLIGFGLNDEEKQALIDIEMSLKKMLVYEENILFFKCWLGSLVIRNPERCILFLYGKKKNAKSAFFNALIDALGPKYGKSLPLHMFYGSGKGGVTCDPFWADAEDMIFGQAPECNSKFPLSGTILKETSGGDLRNTAAKNKDPITYKNSAKIAFTSNNWIQFDNLDAALISRLYPLRCLGIFEENPEDVPESEEEQWKQGIFHADINYYNITRKRALLHKIVTEYFELYTQHGLKKTSYMKKELTEWISQTSEYARFFLELEKPKKGEFYMVPANELMRVFIRRYNKLSQGIDLSLFMHEFEGINQIKSIEKNNEFFYNLKHKEITNFEIIRLVENDTCSFDSGYVSNGKLNDEE